MGLVWSLGKESSASTPVKTLVIILFTKPRNWHGFGADVVASASSSSCRLLRIKLSKREANLGLASQPFDVTVQSLAVEQRLLAFRVPVLGVGLLKVALESSQSAAAMTPAAAMVVSARAEAPPAPALRPPE